MKSFLPLIHSEWRLLLFGFVMTFGSSLGQTYFIGLFSGDIRVDLELSHGDFGGLYSAATLVSALLLLWTGSMIDRMELRRYACLISTGLALACALMAASTTPIILFLALLALRHFGQGLMSLASATTLVRYLDHHKGKANALGGMGYSISEALLPSLVIALLALLGWRVSWLFWGGLLLVTVPLLTVWLLRGHEHRHGDYLRQLQAGTSAGEADQRRQWTREQVVMDPCFYLFMPALLAQPLLFTGFMFHQVQLVDEKGWNLAAWGGLFLFYALVNTLCKLFAGLLVDRFSAIRLAALVCLPLGAGLLVLSSADHFIAAAIFMGLMAVSVGFYSTLSSPFFSEMYGTLHLGSIKSLTTAAMVLATAIAPAVMGWLIDYGASMDAMALGGAAYTILASALALWGRHRLRTSAERN
ncbi:MFS transporter [Pseudohalioglobus lutimaris]|uniref:MFS transporter n=1 Tax=Pseudohalioglobus lutimaris TaxID=1737061 RepID=A0A2N5X0J4_9GAMM|nr:MFS transporter [Pseudohalioglobus lutimaris]PLW68002.1 MFS transporter [Pseudohalioglobus lutimaris]